MDKKGPERGDRLDGIPWPDWMAALAIFLEAKAARAEGVSPRPIAEVCAEIERAARELAREREVSSRASAPAPSSRPGSRE